MSERFNDYLVDQLRPLTSGRDVIFSDVSFLSSLDLARRLGIRDFRMLSFKDHGVSGHLGDRQIASPEEMWRTDQQIAFFKHPELQGWARTPLDAWDPGKKALVIASPRAEIEPGDQLFGRETLGGRRRSWTRFEDKSLVDKILFGPAGIPTPRSVVIPAGSSSTLGPARNAFLALQRNGNGVVVSAGSEFGINTSANSVRLVRSEEELERAYSDLAHEGRSSLRIAQFVPGISASTSGMVFPDGTVKTFITFEHFMMVDDDGRFHFTGFGGSWRPPHDVQRNLVAAVSRVGQRMHATSGYVGVFDMDVIISTDGRIMGATVGDGNDFVANELNSRYGGGPDRLARAAGVPWALFNAAVISSPKVWPNGATDYQSDLLHETIMSETIAHPWATPVRIPLTEHLSAAQLQYALGDDGRWHQHPQGPVSVEIIPQSTGSQVIIDGLLSVVPKHDNPVPLTSIIEPLVQDVAGTVGSEALGRLQMTYRTDNVRTHSLTGAALPGLSGTT